jgi:cell division ATPase FtsA
MTSDLRQERVHRLLSTAGPATPPGLRERIASQTARPVRRSRPRVVLAGAVATAAFAVVLVLTLVAQLGSHPTIAEAARPSALAATAPAPAQDARRPTMLRASFAGVTYPDWNRQFGWRTTGRRHDSLEGGRTAETVFYQHTHHRIGYTVVSGKPLERPGHAQRFVVNGLQMLAYKDGRRDVVTFERNGRTCILAGVVHRRSTLVKLASWKADGAIVF